MLHSPVSPTIPSPGARRRQGACGGSWARYDHTDHAADPCLLRLPPRNVCGQSMTAPDNARLAGEPAVLPRAAAWALAVLTVLNFFNYVDRYVLAAVVPLLHHDPAFARVSDADLGFLQFVFLLVYMIVSPIGGALGDRVP